MSQPHASPIALAEVVNKNADVVSWWVGEGIRRCLDDCGFAAELDGLDAQLLASLIQVQGASGGDWCSFPTSESNDVAAFWRCSGNASNAVPELGNGWLTLCSRTKALNIDPAGG